MSQIKASTSTCRLTPSVGHPGAEAILEIKNLNKELLSSDKISIYVDAPEHVNVQLERATKSGDEWNPFYDIDPEDSILIPLFVRSEAYRQERGGSISVLIEADNETYEMEIELIN